MAEQIALRPVTTGDLPILFEQQREPEAIWMAAFTAKDPSDLCHAWFGEPEVSYGLGKAFWGRGAEVEEWLFVRGE